MRQRITFLHRREDAIDPKQLHISESDLSVTHLRAAKEHRWTLGYDELPAELLSVLKQSRELHIRWSTPQLYRSISPYISRVSPGLHVQYTPRQNLTDKNQEQDRLCPALKQAFSPDLKCQSVQDAFSSAGQSKQYYHLLPSLDHFTSYIQQSHCPDSSSCHDHAASLSSADYVDIDTDSTSQTLILNAYWANGPDDGTWTTNIQTSPVDEKVEVGILSNEAPTEEDELSLSGFLTVLGQDTKPSPVLFSFPSRHQHLPSTSSVSSTYNTTFLHPSGLHPTLQLSFPTAPTSHLSLLSSQPSPPLSLPDPDTSCSLNAYVTLPSYLFVDKYQLSDPLFLQSKHLRAIKSLVGATDLEAPDWAVSQWGSAVLLELDPSHKDIHVPLHLRYLEPAAGGIRTVHAPAPVVFWTCATTTEFQGNPFDRTHLGYDSLFGPDTVFYHYTPSVEGNDIDYKTLPAGHVHSREDLLVPLDVPVLDTESLTGVEWGTIFVVFIGAAWIAWKLWSVVGTKRNANDAAQKKRE